MDKAMKLSSSVGKVVKSLRLAKGMTQTELAERCSLHRTYVSSIESGRRNPTILTLIEIAEAMNACPIALFTSVHSEYVRK